MTAPEDTLQQSLESLPHGDEFRFVDKLSALDPGASGTGHYTVREDAEFLRGHFPGRPMLPAVIMVEALAQLGGVVAQSDPNQPTLNDVRLTAMRNVKVMGTAIPSERLDISARVAGRLGNLIQIEGEVSCDTRQLVKAQVTLSGQLPDEA
jgi:3-hydroxyacyl-[acyl-carrier-protein] dehydratase